MACSGYDGHLAGEQAFGVVEVRGDLIDAVGGCHGIWFLSPLESVIEEEEIEKAVL